MGITRKQFYKWKVAYEEIANALLESREIVDYNVENALLKAALGYTTKEVKVTLGKTIKGGQAYEVLKETTIKEIAPNVGACQFWLTNRLPDKWKKNRDAQLNLGDEDSNITITINRASNNDTGESSEVSESDDYNTVGDTNDSITLRPATEEEKKEHKKEAKEEKAKNKKEKDLDYWPDDWEDDLDE
jgi:hypothetical protein